MAGSKKTWLAWNGWRLRMPTDWRPLRVYGDAAKGNMVIGDAASAIMQIKWRRHRSARFDPQAWLARRARAMGADERASGGDHEGFSATAWLPAARSKRGARRSIWYGFAPGPALMIEIVVSPAVAPAIGRRIVPRVLESLGARAASEPTRWAIFGSSFETPPGFAVAGQRLQLGDIALDLRARGGRRLLVRQVYPAELALKRRSIEKWLSVREFKERRVYRADAEPTPCSLEAGARRFEGLEHTGRKVLAWPLGFVAPLRVARIIAHDKELDRLLIAKYDRAGRGAVDLDVPRRLIAAMNWAMESDDGNRTT